jgi:hypothetical protein
LDDCCCATFCGCCVITQLAAHTLNELKGQCSFEAPPTLAGYEDPTQRPAYGQPQQAAYYPQQPAQVPGGGLPVAMAVPAVPNAEPFKPNSSSLPAEV